jgi:hypothetical protein
VDSLDVVGVIVSPCAAEAAGVDVFRDHIGVVSEFLLADCAFPMLERELAVISFRISLFERSSR